MTVQLSRLLLLPQPPLLPQLLLLPLPWQPAPPHVHWSASLQRVSVAVRAGPAPAPPIAEKAFASCLGSPPPTASASRAPPPALPGVSPSPAGPAGALPESSASIVDREPSTLHFSRDLHPPLPRRHPHDPPPRVASLLCGRATVKGLFLPVAVASSSSVPPLRNCASLPHLHPPRGRCSTPAVANVTEPPPGCRRRETRPFAGCCCEE